MIGCSSKLMSAWALHRPAHRRPAVRMAACRSRTAERSPQTQEDPIKAEFVKLRNFASLSVEQTAQALGISRATADRYWSYAKVWLNQAVTGEDELTLGSQKSLPT
jgi:hypothetical protein